MPITPKDTDQSIKTLTEDVEGDVREIALAWYRAIKSGTPVDTGFHRENWFADSGAVRARVRGSPESVPQGGDAVSARSIQSWRLGSGSIFIHNSAPAIVFLDEGSSAQAPQGILDPAFAAVRSRFGFG